MSDPKRPEKRDNETPDQTSVKKPNRAQPPTRSQPTPYRDDLRKHTYYEDRDTWVRRSSDWVRGSDARDRRTYAKSRGRSHVDGDEEREFRFKQEEQFAKTMSGHVVNWTPEVYDTQADGTREWMDGKTTRGKVTVLFHGFHGGRDDEPQERFSLTMPDGRKLFAQGREEVISILKALSRGELKRKFGK